MTVRPYDLTTRFQLRGASLRLSARGELLAWHTGDRQWRVVAPEVRDFVTRFGGSSPISVAQALAALEADYDLDEGDAPRFVGMLPDLVQMALLEEYEGPTAQLFDMKARDPAPAQAPAFLVSTPRAGSTFFLKLLGSHPRLHAVSESYLFDLLLETQDLDSADRVELSLASQGFARGELRRRAVELATTLLDDSARRHGKERWIEKSTYLSPHLDAVDHMLDHQARFVVLVRHGFDVAHSLLCRRAKVPAEYVVKNELGGRAFLPAMAMRFWRDHAELQHSFCRRIGERALLVRYEDLVREPVETCRLVFRFLGDPWDSVSESELFGAPPLKYAFGDAATRHEHGTPRSARRAWESWPRETLDELLAVGGATLTKLGYPTP